MAAKAEGRLEGWRGPGLQRRRRWKRTRPRNGEHSEPRKSQVSGREGGRARDRAHVWNSIPGAGWNSAWSQRGEGSVSGIGFLLACDKHMCDLTWEEVKVTHKQLNAPGPSISNPGWLPGVPPCPPARGVRPQPQPPHPPPSLLTQLPRRRGRRGAGGRSGTRDDTDSLLRRQKSDLSSCGQAPRGGQ